MDPITLRAVERILAVAIGGIAICLGFRLFLAVPTQRDGSGSVKLPWNISVGLARVGPGVFFALFGALVVGYSLHGEIHMVYRPTTGVPMSSPPGTIALPLAEVHGTGAVASVQTPSSTLAARRMNSASSVEFLNTLGRLLRSDLDEAQLRAVQTQTTALKLAVMQPLWGPDWGDASEFRDWVAPDASVPGPPQSKTAPPQFEAAARFFRIGERGAP